MVDGSGGDSRDTEKENLQVWAIGSLVMGVNERAEVRVTFRFLVWAASRLRDRAGSHWGGLEGPSRANWNVSSVITLGFSPLRTFFRLIHCENLGCFFFLPPHLSPT